MAILYPTANNVVECTPSTGTNYTCVDDVTLDTEDSVGVTANSDTEYIVKCDDFVLGDIEEGLLVNSVKAFSVVGSLGWQYGYAKIKFHVTIGGTKYYSPEFTIDSLNSVFSYEWVKNPATGNDWTASVINGMTAGYTLYVKGSINETSK